MHVFLFLVESFSRSDVLKYLTVCIQPATSTLAYKVQDGTGRGTKTSPRLLFRTQSAKPKNSATPTSPGWLSSFRTQSLVPQDRAAHKSLLRPDVVFGRQEPEIATLNSAVSELLRRA